VVEHFNTRHHAVTPYKLKEDFSMQLDQHHISKTST